MRARPARQIFICYRRDDTGAYAGRLNDALCNDFGEDNVFFDRGGGIDAGDDWKQVIDERLESCAALIVMIGTNWRPARLADPEDIVRREISSALERDVRIIPVLVNDATLPSAAVLPGELKSFLGRQMMEMTDRHWRADYEHLAKSIRKEIVRRKKRNPSPLFTQRTVFAALAVMLALALVFMATKKWVGADVGTDTSNTGRAPSPSPPLVSTINPVGVDVGYMKNRDWANPELRDVSFAFVDADQPEFSRMREEVRSRNLIGGAYQVLYDIRDPIAQADRFIQTVKPSEYDVLLGVNVSPLQSGNQPTKDLSARLHRYLDRIRQLTGKRPFIYVTTDSWNANFDDTFGSYPLWLTKFEQLPHGWSRVSLEQEVKDGGSTITFTFKGTLEDLEEHAKKR